MTEGHGVLAKRLRGIYDNAGYTLGAAADSSVDGSILLDLDRATLTYGEIDFISIGICLQQVDPQA